MNTQLVSLLIPTYNQAGYLKQAVESALNQEYPHLEVIICDDASLDWDPDLLAEFAADPRLRIHRNQVNLGRVGNYRHGLYDLASGYWVLILDGDDYLKASGYIARAMQITAADASIDLVFSNAARMKGADMDDLLAPHENKTLPEVMEGTELFLKLAQEDVSVFHSTALYKRDKAIALDFYRSDIVSSDWESLHRYILTGKVAFIDTIASVWRIHGMNTTRNLSAKDRSDNLQAIAGPYLAAKTMGIFKASSLEDWFSTRLWKIVFKDVRSLLKMRDRDGLAYYVAALETISPAIARRVRRSPKLWMRRMATRLASAKN
jgi:glycosyltransferase involved in cell wall biosynthesis